MYRRIKQNIDGRSLSYNEFVYYWYKRADLLNEVRKRTSYLGSRRKTKEGSMLLDEIALTNDESDLFWSFFLDASANVYDVLSGIMKPDTTSYKVFGKKKVVCGLIKDVDNATVITFTNGTMVSDEVRANAIIGLGNNVLDGIKLVGDFDVEYDVEYTMAGVSGVQTESRKQKVENVEVIANKVGTLPIYSANLSFVPTLSTTTDLLSSETFKQITNVTAGVLKSVMITPISANDGEVVEVDGRWYQSNGKEIVDMSDVEKLAELPNDMSDCLMYRMFTGTDFDTNAIPAVDICIFNMLTLYIMWQWLMIASPEDAPLYFQMYNQQKDNLCSRINKYRIGTAVITPRPF